MRKWQRSLEKKKKEKKKKEKIHVTRRYSHACYVCYQLDVHVITPISIN